ncbi:MAG: HNH endonuclease [Candidatus Eisenbacteria bacterium]
MPSDDVHGNAGAVTPAGMAPEAAPIALLAEDLLAAATTTRRTEALLVRSQAAHLAWLAAGDRVLRCGFTSVSSLALEVLGLSPRTVRERLELHRLFVRVPAVERAFLEGRITACQARAAAPILNRLDPADEVSIAGWIETAGRVSVRAMRYEVRSNPAWKAPDDESIIEPDGCTISFPAPVGFQVVFDQTMELARKVLGRDAPIHECISAILTETNWAGLGPAPPDARWAHPPGGIATRPPGSVPVRPAAIARARETLEQVRTYIREVRDLIEAGEPRSPHDALVALRQIQLLRAPQKVLFAHLIRDLRRTQAMDLLGYRSMAEMVEDRLNLSERSARNRVAESLLFEGDAEIEEAFGRGEITLMQAHLIKRFAHGAQVGPFVERARRVTWRQLRRESRLLDLLRRCNLGRLARRPLPQEQVEEVLIEALGGDREEVERTLRGRGIPALPEDGSADPAENSILMERLEALVELLAVTKWDGVSDATGADRQTFAAGDREIRIRFWAPKPVAEDFLAVIDRFRKKHRPRIPIWAAAVLLFAGAVEEWERQDPERRPVQAKILRRDRYRCIIPGCINRDRLEAHHNRPRSQGGSDDPSNLSTICHRHHRHGIHAGYVRITGKAPHALRFELGRRRDGPPLLILAGEKIIARALA